MAARRQLIAGNWKMNGRRADGIALAKALADRRHAEGDPGCDLLICPPATLIAPVADVLAGGDVLLGGQDCHAEETGAHTGDISAEMLADLGCGYVIVGHSERRLDHGEADKDVWAKAKAAQRAGLCAIVCVGETEPQRDRGEALDVVRRQLAGSLPDAVTATGVVIAYEPVWAIGTGRTPSPEDVAEVHAAIREHLRGFGSEGEAVRILYGGSVKPSNAVELLAVPDVDGALVGGASLVAEDFWAIAAAATK